MYEYANQTMVCEMWNQAVFYVKLIVWYNNNLCTLEPTVH